jgi:hypothetical protein
VGTILMVAVRVCVAEHWSAEPWLGAANLTAVEGPGVSDIHQDLSGGFRKPVVRRLWVCRVDVNESGTVSVQDVFDFLASYFGGSPGADFNLSGAIGVQDIFDFLAACFVAC